MFHDALREWVMRLKILSLLVLLLSAGWGHAASAPELSGRQNEILRTAMSASGYITPDMHREFWSIFPAETRSDTVLLAYTERKLTALYRYHREVIASAKLSLKARRILFSAQYDAAKAEFISIDAQDLPTLPGSTIAYGEAFIKAAGSGESIRGPNGMLSVDAQKIDDLDGGIDGSLVRMQLLLQPEWKTTPKEYLYSDAKIAIVSDVPFTRRSRLIKTGRHEVILVQTLSQAIDGERFVAVANVNLHVRSKDPNGALIAVLDHVLRHFDAALGEPPRFERWRGSPSVQTSVYVIGSESNRLVRARAVFRNENSSVAVLLSRSGQAAGDDLFAQLEKAVRFLDVETARQ